MDWLYYTHKPTEIRASVWHKGDSLAGIINDATGIRCFSRPDHPEGERADACIRAVHGFHAIFDGDYICRGDAGELYPLPPHVFEAAYDLKPRQPRKPFDEAGMEQSVQSHVQSSVDRKA